MIGRILLFALAAAVYPQLLAVVVVLKARASAALDRGSIAVAGLVGALHAIPGPFDLLALGRRLRA